MGIPNLRKIESAIGLPVAQWHGRCYEVACAIVESGLVKGEAVYGHYLGPVAAKGHWARRKDNLFQRHGWIVLQDETIIDPTRWSFENAEPYLAVVLPNSKRTAEYDRGGNKFREALGTPPPAYDRADEPVDFFLDEPGIREFVYDILKQPPTITLKMVFWVANLPPNKLGRFAKPLYRTLEAGGYRAFIPIDNREMILGKEE